MKPILRALVCMLMGGVSLGVGAQPATELTLVKSIEMRRVDGRLDHMAIDAKTKRLYVAALGNDSVEIVDLAAGNMAGAIEGVKSPQGVCALEMGNVAVTSGAEGACRIYDKDQKLLATIDGLSNADAVRYDAKGKLLYVGYGSGALAVIDPKTFEKVGEIALDAHPESFQLENKGNRIFVNLKDGEIAVIDRVKREVTETWLLKGASGNHAMALTEDDTRLLIACREPARLVVLNTHDGALVAEAECAGDADDVWYNAAAKKAYVTGDGEISVISRGADEAYAAAETVKSGNGAGTSLLNASDKQLYVAVPRNGDEQAQIQVYKEAPPKKMNLPDVPNVPKPNVPLPNVPKPNVPNVPKPSIPKPKIPGL